MSRTTYRLLDGTTRVSTAVKLKHGTILMVYPRMETFADIDLWKWVIEHEENYTNSSLTLTTTTTAPPPEPLSPYNPPLPPIKIDNFKLGPTAEGTPLRIRITPPVSPRGEFQEPIPYTITLTPQVSPYPEIEEPLPSAPVKSYNPCELRQTADGPGYDEDYEVHQKWLMKHELTNIQSDLATLARSMNERFNLMDVRIKALIKKLD